MSTTDSNDGDDTKRIELPSGVYDLLLSYQADDEEIAETLERVMKIVPHPARLPDGVDRHEVEEERFVIERQKDIDGLLDTYTYDSAYNVYKGYKESMEGGSDSPRLSEGDEIIDCGDRGEVVNVLQGSDPIAYEIEHESGQTNHLTAPELELALVDGSIEVVGE